MPKLGANHVCLLMGIVVAASGCAETKSATRSAARTTGEVASDVGEATADAFSAAYRGAATGVRATRDAAGYVFRKAGEGTVWVGRKITPGPDQGQGMTAPPPDLDADIGQGAPSSTSDLDRQPVAGGATAEDDARIGTTVRARLEQDPALRAADIDVQVSRGVVTLTGFAPSYDLAARAARTAVDVPGVDHVESKLRVDEAAGGR